MKNKAFILLALCSLLFVQAKAQELLNYPLDTVNGEEVYRYQVEKSIGLYRVGVNFNVSQSEIVRLNPQLRERGLHFGETLLIPTKRPVVISTKPRIVETIVKETKVMPEPEPKDTVISVSRDTEKRTYYEGKYLYQAKRDGHIDSVGHHARRIYQSQHLAC